MPNLNGKKIINGINVFRGKLKIIQNIIKKYLVKLFQTYLMQKM